MSTENAPKTLGLKYEAKMLLKNPLRVFSKSWWSRMFYKVSPSKAGKWEKTSDGFRVRTYSTYEDYVAHQKSKLKLFENTSDYDQRLRSTLGDRLKSRSLRGKSVLCLAARIGSEVKAFADNGCFAVGIDLNPGTDNKYVLPGDFHSLQFPDSSVDVVYSNSLDHALELSKVLAEIHRVIKSDGCAIIDAVNGASESNSTFGDWEASEWDKITDLIEVFNKAGFLVVEKREISEPWNGMEITFKKK